MKRVEVSGMYSVVVFLISVYIFTVLNRSTLKTIERQNDIIIKHWEYQNGIRIEKNDSTYQYIQVTVPIKNFK